MLLFTTAFVISFLVTGALTSTTGSPEGCRVMSGDTNWPKPEVWQKELPGVTPRKIAPNSFHPDYQISARTVQDVQNAVKFVAKYKIRLSIINSGHDYLGRNDAPDGLWLDVSRLSGVRVLETFEPTMQGASSPDPSGKVNVITPKPGVQPAATLGAGLSAVELNKSLKASKVFAISGTAPGVRIAGGWGQHGGHGPLTNMYGMGVDQWLEFQIVTADGKLKVANAVANPDLFWAIRGGGGGTFGVVVQATVKVHPHVPITTYAWSMISTSASIVNTVGIGNGSAGLYEAITYMASQLPSIADRASSAYLYMYPGRLRGFSITIAENATAEHIKSLWNPMLNKLSTFEGIPPHQSHILTFANYQEFMDYTYLDGMTSGCYTAVSKSSFNFPSILKPNTNCQKSTSAPADQQTVGKPQRKDPSAPGMFSRLDSILMGPDILLNPKLKETMKAMPVGGGWLMLSGNKAHRPDQDVSLLPAWRKAYVHAMSLDLKPLVTMDPYRKLAAEPSAYGNEALPNLPNWKTLFWGSNYAKLSNLKSRYDPETIFWVSPGINADMMEVKQGRLCNSTATPLVRQGPSEAPSIGNKNTANVLLSNDEMFGGLEKWVKWPGADWKDIEGKVEYRA